MRPGDIYWREIEPVWDVVSIYDGGRMFLRQFGEVTTAQQHLIATHWCQSEVCNGGFHQFYSNPTGVLAPEAVRGFEALGLLEAAGVVAKTMEYFSQPYPREQQDRLASLVVVPGAPRREWDPFYERDLEFYEAIDSEHNGYERSADIYVLRSRSLPAV
jgi:hypothetical protein